VTTFKMEGISKLRRWELAMRRTLTSPQRETETIWKTTWRRTTKPTPNSTDTMATASTIRPTSTRWATWTGRLPRGR
jgi:hypothetical protein